MPGARTRLVDLLEDLLGQHLAELDAPLVERVDVPDGALGEGEVLIVDDERTELGGTNMAADEDAGGGPVAKEDLVGDEVLGHVALGADLVGGLADHKSLGLSEVVGRKHLLVEVVRDGVVRLGGEDEVGGDQLGALVDELEEGVLGVGARLAEEDRTGGVLGRGTVRGDGLAVGLHRELLEVGREAVEVLVEGSDEVSLGVVEVGVPDAQETTEHGNVLLKGSGAEVVVHGVGTSEELVEVLEANVESDGQADGGPNGVATTNPALETEHVLGVNTELGDLGLVGRKSNEVLGDLALTIGLLEEPRLGGVGIGGGLGGGEGLGGNEEEGSLGVGGGEGLGHVGAVNVGDEVKGHVLGAIVLEGLSDHDGAPVVGGVSQLLVSGSNTRRV